MTGSGSLASCRFTANPASLCVMPAGIGGHAIVEPAAPPSQDRAAGPSASRPLSDALVVSALAIIAREDAKIPNVEALVERLNVSRRTLEGRFRTQLGRTILEELTRHRVLHAQKILADSELSIPQAARAAGFSDERCMLRAFRTVLGVSPRDYRRMIVEGDAA